MIRRPPRSTLSSSSAASDVYKRQQQGLADKVRVLEELKEVKCRGPAGSTSLSPHPNPHLSPHPSPHPGANPSSSSSPQSDSAHGSSQSWGSRMFCQYAKAGGAQVPPGCGTFSTIGRGSVEMELGELSIFSRDIGLTPAFIKVSTLKSLFARLRNNPSRCTDTTPAQPAPDQPSWSNALGFSQFEDFIICSTLLIQQNLIPESSQRVMELNLNLKKDTASLIEWGKAVSYTHLRAHETPEHLVCRLLLEKKKKKTKVQLNDL
eukprot:TRINITY_DN12643_c0_g1_i6.p1 TRINITY_DN12643_c0_g1~~TRINITY_DN12643_c0_g1_i6.p1  ORF type:complete len:263 (+),score=57.35 TRINITY_DN12643_c0_g1_i6:138-926(+)